VLALSTVRGDNIEALLACHLAVYHGAHHFSVTGLDYCREVPDEDISILENNHYDCSPRRRYRRSHPHQHTRHRTYGPCIHSEAISVAVSLSTHRLTSRNSSRDPCVRGHQPINHQLARQLQRRRGASLRCRPEIRLQWYQCLLTGSLQHCRASSRKSRSLRSSSAAVL